MARRMRHARGLRGITLAGLPDLSARLSFDVAWVVGNVRSTLTLRGVAGCHAVLVGFEYNTDRVIDRLLILFFFWS